MEMRKFIVEIHPDGRLTCCEYEEPREACNKSAWLAGYRQAVTHCKEEVDLLGAFSDVCQFPQSAKLMVQGAAQVLDTVESHYHEYSK